jgi:hypothetical protein
MMFGKGSTVYSVALAVLALAAVGCSDDTPTDTPQESTVYGTPSTLGGGQVRSFMKLNADGNPMEVGLRISKRTVDSLTMTPSPNHMEHMYEIALPAGMSTKTAFQDISLDWNAMGHPPSPIYDTAHFDMHFYTVPRSERMAWSMTDTAKLNMRPDASLVPAAHFTDGTGIPMMGLHYVSTAAPEFNGGGFSSTFIWGYYNGAQVFMEPMITKWFLQSKASFSSAIAMPASFTRTGVYYPTKYSVSYDNATNEHVVTMSDMVLK